MYNLIITALLIASFFMCLTCYFIGIKHGKNMSKGKLPRMPLKVVKGSINKLKPKEDNKLEQDINNIMSYNADIALDAVKRMVIKNG